MLKILLIICENKKMLGIKTEHFLFRIYIYLTDEHVNEFVSVCSVIITSEPSLFGTPKAIGL